MKKSILGYISRSGGPVSFVQLCRGIKEFNGEYEMSFKNNMVLWDGLSETAILAINQLKDENKIIIKASVTLVYLMDGGRMKLPVVKRNIKYKRRHWLPVLFWTPEQ